MKKRFRLTTIILVILITIISNNENTSIGIDNYYFVIGIGLDKGGNNSINLSIQIPSSSAGEKSDNSGSSQSGNYEIYSVEGNTINECITILNSYLNKQINLSHCTAIVISEELAKEDIRPYFYTLNNNNELRHSSSIIISSTKAYDVLNNISKSGKVFSSRLYDYLIVSSNYTAYTINSTLGTFFGALNNDYRQISAIYTIQTEGNIIQPGGIAVFKDAKMVGTLSPIDSICHSIITNKLNTTVLTIDNPFNKTGKMDLDINLYKSTSTKIDLINTTPYISISIYPEGIIRSSGEKFDYSSQKNIEIVEDEVNSYLEKCTKEYLYKITKEYKSDIVGFKGICKSKYLTEEDFNKIHFDEIFPDSFYNVSINTKISSSHLFNKE